MDALSKVLPIVLLKLKVKNGINHVNTLHSMYTLQSPTVYIAGVSQWGVMHVIYYSNNMATGATDS